MTETLTPSLERVLHVIPALAPRYGGPSAATLGLCRALNRAGVTTLVATTDADGPARLNVQYGSPQTYEGIETIFFRRHMGEGFKWSSGLAAWLDAHVDEFQLVHVHAVFSHSSLAAGRACRRAGVPYVVRPLGTLDPWSVGRKPLRKRVLFECGVRDLLRGAAAIHYTSREEGRLAETVVRDLPRGVVVPLGIDDVFFESESPQVPGVPYVLALSRLDAKKGIDLLIRAFHRVVTDDPQSRWELVIAGDGEPSYVEMLQGLAHAGAGAARIRFAGWISGREKVSLVREAALFTLPSHQENFGISVAESLAAGVPVIVTPGVNLAEDIQRAEAGWTVERAEAAVAGALQGAMRDPAERARRGGNARRMAETFRWPNVARRLMDCYGHIRATQPMPVPGV